jgi:hypothetical protein
MEGEAKGVQRENRDAEHMVPSLRAESKGRRLSPMIAGMCTREQDRIRKLCCHGHVFRAGISITVLPLNRITLHVPLLFKATPKY